MFLLSALAVSAAEVMPLEKVTPGMKGYGLTVLSRAGLERFGVEVLGVQRNTSPGRSTILVRLSGLGLEESGVIAGMSGSPVYVDGKLLGAVASGWGFSKQPLAGVTPIETMTAFVLSPRGSPATALRQAPGGKPLAAFSRLLSRLADPIGDAERVEELRQFVFASLPASTAGLDGSRPLISLAAGGVPAETLERFREPLVRLGLPLTAPLGAPEPRGAGSSGSGSTLGSARMATAASDDLRPGSSITVFLVQGDAFLGASGTVTEVFPDGRFLAFGHPLLGMGDVDLPVGTGNVIGVVSSVFQSFKLVSGGVPRHRLTCDRDAGLCGRVGEEAATIPVSLRFEAEDGNQRSFKFRISAHPKLLPPLVALVADAALTAVDPTPRERTLAYKVSLDAKAGPYTYEDIASGSRAKEISVLTCATLAAAVADNDVEDPEIRGVELSFRSIPAEKRARLVEATVVPRRVSPGEAVSITLRLLDRRGASVTKVIQLEVPRETPEGRATVAVADGSAATQLKQSLGPVEPESLAQLARFLSHMVPSNRVVAALLVPARGMATRSDTLTALPPTAAALLANARSPGDEGSSDVDSRILSEKTITLDRPVSGAIRIEIEVRKPRS